MAHLASFLKPDPSGVCTECALNSSKGHHPLRLMSTWAICVPRRSLRIVCLTAAQTVTLLSWNCFLPSHVGFHPTQIRDWYSANNSKGPLYRFLEISVPSCSVLCLANCSKSSLPSLCLLNSVRSPGCPWAPVPVLKCGHSPFYFLSQCLVMIGLNFPPPHPHFSQESPPLVLSVVQSLGIFVSKVLYSFLVSCGKRVIWTVILPPSEEQKCSELLYRIL